MLQVWYDLLQGGAHRFFKGAIAADHVRSSTAPSGETLNDTGMSSYVASPPTTRTIGASRVVGGAAGTVGPLAGARRSS